MSVNLCVCVLITQEGGGEFIINTYSGGDLPTRWRGDSEGRKQMGRGVGRNGVEREG